VFIVNSLNLNYYITLLYIFQNMFIIVYIYINRNKYVIFSNILLNSDSTISPSDIASAKPSIIFSDEVKKSGLLYTLNHYLLFSFLNLFILF